MAEKKLATVTHLLPPFVKFSEHEAKTEDFSNSKDLRVSFRDSNYCIISICLKY